MAISYPVDGDLVCKVKWGLSSPPCGVSMGKHTSSQLWNTDSKWMGWKKLSVIMNNKNDWTRLSNPHNEVNFPLEDTNLLIKQHRLELDCLYHWWDAWHSFGPNQLVPVLTILNLHRAVPLCPQHSSAASPHEVQVDTVSGVPHLNTFGCREHVAIAWLSLWMHLSPLALLLKPFT